MNDNIIEYQQLNVLSRKIEDYSTEIIGNLIKISKLIEILPAYFNDQEVVKICDFVNNHQIIKAVSEMEKIKLLKNILSKISASYYELDRYYSEKNVIQ